MPVALVDGDIHRDTLVVDSSGGDTEPAIGVGPASQLKVQTERAHCVLVVDGVGGVKEAGQSVVDHKVIIVQAQAQSVVDVLKRAALIRVGRVELIPSLERHLAEQLEE